ncbi:MAG: glycoside hydrolase family 16 protein [Gillisia sp.]|nr:glycoside hydrolase family 16 protein [Gillisia sp.]
MDYFTIKRLKKYAFCIIAILGFQQTFGQCPTIVWQDEFDGTTLDLTKWSYQIGDGCDQSLCGWGNNELQSYQESNVVVSNGSLKITAKKERIRGAQYTSGRINSKGKGDFTYGRFEASIKLPAGDGLWPAFWMLSTDEQYGSWPQSGEIDIMEYVASTPNKILGYIHYGDLYPNNQSQGNSIELKNEVFYNTFHEFAIEWEPGEIRWFMDGILYSKKTPENISPSNWSFDKDFHFILNVAVGGNLGGDVVDNMLPATMEVDYVRVYDSFKPYLDGESIISNQESGVQYSLGNLASNVNVTWSVPAGAKVVSGQGSSTILVDFGVESGLVSASFDNGCTSQSLNLPVELEPRYIKSFSFENFDDPSTVTFVSSAGTLTEVGNPAANTVNSSAVSGKYVRDSQSQYDLIRYSVSDITDASLYAMKDKKFYMDVYSNAPVGTEIMLQLETADATASNFPVGRHSRYKASIKENNSWHRLKFNLLDEPDPAALDSAVETMCLLFNSNTFTSNTYYYDNLDSYDVDNDTVSNQNP